MKLSASEFTQWPNKAITLLGMSGIGKTTLANKLPKSKWFHYSGDYRIGTKYLEEPILDNIKERAMEVVFLKELLKTDSIYISSNITVDNLAPISTFLGKIGAPSKGGLNPKEFLRRQELHKKAETEAMIDVPGFIEKSKRIYGYDNFINDAGGSICELVGTDAMEALIKNTMIVYIEENQEIKDTLIERAKSYPKPLYYNTDFLMRNLENYENEMNESSETMDPDAFVRWIFPKLLKYRKTKYETIASQHGYTIQASDAIHVNNESDFLGLIVKAIESQ
jgi:adenylate kinase family enzyme